MARRLGDGCVRRQVSAGLCPTDRAGDLVAMAAATNPIPSLTVGDDPVERGRLHGARFTREVADNLETYLRRFEASGLTRAAAEAEGSQWLAAMVPQEGENGRRLRRIARSAGP